MATTPTTQARATSPVVNVPSGPAQAAARFLLWARSNGFSVTRVVVEDFSADLSDTRVFEPEGQTEKGPPPPRSVHDAFADEFDLPRPSDAIVEDDPDGEDEP